jgi:hypothetical protein
VTGFRQRLHNLLQPRIIVQCAVPSLNLIHAAHWRALEHEHARARRTAVALAQWNREHALAHPRARVGHAELLLKPDRRRVGRLVCRKPQRKVEWVCAAGPRPHVCAYGGEERARRPTALVLRAVLHERTRRSAQACARGTREKRIPTSLSRRASSSSVRGSWNLLDTRRLTRRAAAASSAPRLGRVSCSPAADPGAGARGARRVYSSARRTARR